MALSSDGDLSEELLNTEAKTNKVAERRKWMIEKCVAEGVHIFAVAVVLFVVLLGMAGIVLSRHGHQRTIFSDGFNSTAHCFQGLLFGLLVGVGLCGRARSKRRGLTVWCCLVGALGLLVYPTYDLGKSGVFAWDIQHQSLGTSTNFFVSIWELTVGLLVGLFAGALYALYALRSASGSFCPGGTPTGHADGASREPELDHPEEEYRGKSLNLKHFDQIRSMKVTQSLYKNFIFNLTMPMYPILYATKRAISNKRKEMLNDRDAKRNLLDGETGPDAPEPRQLKPLLPHKVLHSENRKEMLDRCGVLVEPVAVYIRYVFPLLAYIALAVKCWGAAPELSNSEVTFAPLMVLGSSIVLAFIPNDSADDDLSLGVRVVQSLWERVEALPMKLKFPADTNKEQLEKRANKLTKPYAALLKFSDIAPSDLGRQLLQGVKYSPVYNPRKPFPTAMTYISTYMRMLLNRISVLFMVLLALFPNCYRAGHSGTFSIPSSPGGIYCYIIFVTSIFLPDCALRSVLDGIRCVRIDFTRLCSSLEALGHMLSEETACWYALPLTRITSHDDMLAWVELSELVDTSKRYQRFAGEAAVAYVVLLFGMFGATILYFETYDAEEMELHINLFTLMICLSGTLFLQATWAVICAFQYSLARPWRLQQLRSVAVKQEILLAHLKEGSFKNDDPQFREDLEAARDLVARVAYQWENVDMSVKVLTFTMAPKTLLSFISFIWFVLVYFTQSLRASF